MNNIYWTTFDEHGYRTASYNEDIHGQENIPADAIPLEESEWQLYCTGEYKRNMITRHPEKIVPSPQPMEPVPLSTEERLASIEAAILPLMEVMG